MSIITLIGILTVVLVIVSILFECYHSKEAFAQPSSQFAKIKEKMDKVDDLDTYVKAMTEKIDDLDARVKVIENDMNQEFD